MLKQFIRRYGYVQLNKEDLEVLSDHYGRTILNKPFDREAFNHAVYLGIDCLKAVMKAKSVTSMSYTVELNEE
jgi:hypothetical protein